MKSIDGCFDTKEFYCSDKDSCFYKTTNENTQTLVDMVNLVNHSNILGIIGGFDQLISFLLADKTPNSIVGIDKNQIQIALAEFKKRMIKKHDYKEFMNLFYYGKNDSIKNADELSQIKHDLELNFNVMEFKLKYKKVDQVFSPIIWLKNEENYNIVKENIDRISLNYANLTEIDYSKIDQKFDLIYLSNIFDWFMNKDFNYAKISFLLDNLYHDVYIDINCQHVINKSRIALNEDGKFLFLTSARRPIFRKKTIEDYIDLTEELRSVSLPVSKKESFIYTLAKKDVELNEYNYLGLIPRKGQEQELNYALN